MPETTPQPTPVTRALADYFSVQAKPKSLFLGPPMGLIENMDNSHPAIWDLYKKLKSMDWDETEIDISSCREEFKTRPQEAVRLMKSTLAFQFEGDSNAAHIARLMYPFINNTELMCYITELAKNECLTPDHEVLTPEGWKNIADITTSDKVAQWEYGNILFVHPTQCVAIQHDGDIHSYQSTHFKQIVTPTHRMPTVSSDVTQNDLAYVLSKDLELSPSRSFPVSGQLILDQNVTPIELTQEILMKIAVACIGKVRKNSLDVDVIKFKVPFGAARSIHTLNQMASQTSFNAYRTSKKDNVAHYVFPIDSDVNDYTTLDWLDVARCSTQVMHKIIHEMVEWSGDGIIFKTYLKDDAVKVLTMLHLIGQSGVIRKEINKHGVYKYQVKRVYGLSRVPTDGVKKTVTSYNGLVHCLSVPSSAFLVKHDNTISVTGNCLHALSYKFIVESSFDDPNDFLKEVREIKEAFLRLDNVNTIFQELLEVGAKYTLGMMTDEATIRKLLLKAWVSLYALERIQFISSFAVTFSLAEQGLCESMFVPIAKLVQKISTDEWNIHVDADKAVLRNELSIPEVFAVWLEILPEVQAILDSVVAAEVKWLTDYLFKDSNVTVGIERDTIIAFVQYTAQDVYDFLKLPITWARHTTNPLPLMEKWLSIDNNQASPQEESIGNYLLGGLIDDTDIVNADRYAGLGVKL